MLSGECVVLNSPITRGRGGAVRVMEDQQHFNPTLKSCLFITHRQATLLSLLCSKTTPHICICSDEPAADADVPLAGGDVEQMVRIFNSLISRCL